MNNFTKGKAEIVKHRDLDTIFDITSTADHSNHGFEYPINFAFTVNDKNGENAKLIQVALNLATKLADDGIDAIEWLSTIKEKHESLLKKVNANEKP